MSNNKTKKKYILITGCSSGIGYETAKYLKENKYNIIVSCRKKIDYKKLSQEFEHVVLIDIAKSKSINKSFFSIKKLIKNNTLYAIFCNAGYGQWGAVEDLSINLIKKQFATNIFGHIELINLFIPHMRKLNEGKIIFNSSVLGLVSLPYCSAYNATKFAMEAFAMSLRLELKNTNIKVSLIEPGPIESKFNENALKHLKKINIKKSVHKKKYNKFIKYFNRGRNKFTLPSLSVAKKVHTILKTNQPKSQYYVTLPTYVLSYSRILPNFFFEKFLKFIIRKDG